MNEWFLATMMSYYRALLLPPPLINSTFFAALTQRPCWRPAYTDTKPGRVPPLPCPGSKQRTSSSRAVVPARSAKACTAAGSYRRAAARHCYYYCTTGSSPADVSDCCFCSRPSPLLYHRRPGGRGRLRRPWQPPGLSSKDRRKRCSLS